MGSRTELPIKTVPRDFQETARSGFDTVRFEEDHPLGPSLTWRRLRRLKCAS